MHVLRICLLLAPLAGAAAVDQPVTPYPRAVSVASTYDPQILPREFVVSAVESVRRELKSRTIRVDSTRAAATWQMPDGASLEDAIAHYQGAVGGEVLFTCRSRDCGRSNDWANQVFGEARLYGPDQNQYYRATERDGALISVYLIERGNRRIYAHVEILEPQRTIDAGANAELTRNLAGAGFAVIQGVHPRQDGRLSEAELKVLAELGPRLAIFPRQDVYVVCHLHGADPTDVVLERAGACARASAEALATADGPRLVPFGAGPLLPRPGNNEARVELVLPQRHSSD